MKIHVVCSQMPSHNASGYAIDVFYRLKAMQEMGFDTQLHLCFKDGEDNLLLEELCQDDAPILFEGTGTCRLLSHPKLRERRKFVRIHSLRSDYYRQLARQHRWTLRGFRYWRKSRGWQYFEKCLQYAEIICCMTKADQQYFLKRMPDKSVVHMPCFFDATPPARTYTPEPFVLFHGNFVSEDNREVARFIIDQIAPLCSGTLFVIAGWQANFEHVPDNVKLIADPSDEYLTQLIQTASVHLMLAMQASGFRVKLINTLVKCNAPIVANRPMLYGHSMGKFCYTANTPKEIAETIRKLMTTDECKLLREDRREKTIQKMKKAGISRLSLFK